MADNNNNNDNNNDNNNGKKISVVNSTGTTRWEFPVAWIAAQGTDTTQWIIR